MKYKLFEYVNMKDETQIVNNIFYSVTVTLTFDRKDPKVTTSKLSKGSYNTTLLVSI